MSSVDDETIMDVLTESDAPRLTTTDVAEELPLARGTVRSRLQTLADEGRLDRERDGRDVVWFLPDRATEPAPEAEPDADDGDEEGDGSDRPQEGEQDAAGAGADAGEAGDDDGGGEEAGEEPGTANAGEAPASGGEDGTGDDAEPTAITERGETVAADAGSGAEVADRPIDRVDEDLLARAAIAAVLLAVIYAVFRRIRGEP